jgi:hypothetical protein
MKYWIDAHRFLVVLTLLFLVSGVQAGSPASDSDLRIAFSESVSPRIQVPVEIQNDYSNLLQDAIHNANVSISSRQYVVLVDRNPYAQIVMIYFGSSITGWGFIGAAPTSTGLPGQFDHFLTPLGVFEHDLNNPDFRAEGTKNELGFRGYGEKGMRVYDFGWVEQYRGWGNGEKMLMRLQMHSTDPKLAENLLGNPKSKGCIRIPASLNTFIDRYGLLDANYDNAMQRGVHFWVIRPDRTPVNSPGRFLVVIDSQLKKRPTWIKYEK